MRRTSKIVSGLLLLALLPALAGCYHATVNTGAEPGMQTIEKPWASSFIYGLIPPSTVNAMNQCDNGVARVETQHSFLNIVVQSVTFGLYSPMSIKVTCASGGMGMDDAEVLDTREEVKEALENGETFLVPTR